MAEENQTSQVVEKPAETAPVDPDIDNLLETIPDLKEVFGSESGQPEQKPTETPQTESGVSETALSESEIPEGLKPEEPTATEPEPKKEDVLSESVQKRIDKLTAQKKTAEERATSLQTELDGLKSKFVAPPPVAPTEASPLSDIENDTDLTAKINHIQEAKTWCIRHLDGGEVDNSGTKQWLDGQTVKSILANAELMLSKHVPERKEFIANKRVFDGEAQREYPAMFKEGTEANKTYKQWLTVFPECRRYPDIGLIIGDAIVGQKIRLDRAKVRNGKVPIAGQPLAPPAPAASPRVPQQRTPSGQQLAEAFANDPNGAFNSFVDSLIEGGAAQRAAPTKR